MSASLATISDRGLSVARLATLPSVFALITSTGSVRWATPRPGIGSGNGLVDDAGACAGEEMVSV